MSDQPRDDGFRDAMTALTNRVMRAAAADHPLPPSRLDGEPTPAYTARVLAAEGAPGHMVSLAREGHYDDFLSPLAFGLHQLAADAIEANLPEYVLAWVGDGVFDATKVESDAWAKSPEGQSVFTELVEGGKNRAQRRADEKRRRRER